MNDDADTSYFHDLDDEAGDFERALAARPSAILVGWCETRAAVVMVRDACGDCPSCLRGYGWPTT